MSKLRILAASLALSLILPTTYPVFADNEETLETVTTAAETVKSASISDEVKTLLSSLGILTEAEMTTNDFVERSFAAEVIVRMAGLDTSQEATGTVYNDVDVNTLYAYSIEKATEMGYFAGTGDGNFNPDGIITDKQMATVLMRFSGYDGKIPLDSVYGKLGKGVNSADDLSYRDLAYMLYNFLDMGTINLENISKSGNSYTINGDKNILNDWFSVYVAEGIIQKTGKTALFSSSDIAKDEIALNTSDGLLTIKIGDTNVARELGKFAKVYYKIDPMTDKLVCIGYLISESRNKIAEFSLNDFDIENSTATTLYYYENGTQKKVAYTPSTAVIYNEYYYADGIFSPSLLSNKEGTVCAIDNDSNNTYDVIYIEAYEAHRVKSVVLSSNTINYSDGGSIVLDENHYDEFSITYPDGVKAYLEDFTENTVVSVAESCSSANFRTAKVIVSKDIAEGTVTAVDEDDAGYTVITIDNGEVYRLMGCTYNEFGKGVRIFKTFLGNAVNVEIAGDVGFRFGFLADFKYNKREDTLYVKVLNTSNEYEEFTVSKKLRVDGVTYKSVDGMKAALEAPQDAAGAYEVAAPGGVTPMHRYPIRYMCNDDGVLIEIDTPHIGGTETRHNSLHNYYYDILDSNSTGYRWGFMNNYVLGFETPVKPSTVFFHIECTELVFDPTSTDYNPWNWKWTQETFNNTDFTSVKTASSLASTYATKNIRYYAYRCDSDNDSAEYILTISGPGNSTNNTEMFMYEKKFLAYDEENDEVVTKLVGYKQGVKTEIAVAPEYLSDSKVAGLQPGDVITYGTDGNGRLSGVWEIAKHVYAASTESGENEFKLRSVRDSGGNDTLKKKVINETNKKLSAAIVFGYVLERTNDLIRLKNVDLTSGVGNDRSATTVKYSDIKAPGGDEVWIRIPANTPVTVYNPSKDEPVYVGTYDEILGGAKKSFIAIRYGSNTTIQEIVAFNEDF